MISKIAKIPTVANLYRVVAPYILHSKTIDCGSFKMKLVANRKVSDIATVFMMNGYYERATSRFFKECLSPGSQMVDIGANAGYFSLLASSIVGPLGKVFAVEPEYGNVTALRQNILLNKFANIQIYPIAAGSHCNSSAKLHLSNGDSRHSLVESKYHKISIPVCEDKLDNILKDVGWITLIKIDTEGTELQVLMGAVETVKKAKFLVIEFGREDDRIEDLWDYINTLGIKDFWIINDFNNTIVRCYGFKEIKQACQNPSDYINLICMR
jgi:FkbM family methyltransferase